MPKPTGRICATLGCDADVKVLDTRRSPMSDKIVRRRVRCARGHVNVTYELPEVLFNAVRYQTRVAVSTHYNTEKQQKSAWIEQMRAERLAGDSCPLIAKRHGLSLDMARYYTRLPRHTLYPAVKPKTKE